MFISDCDCCAFRSILAAKSYGDDVTITKSDCIGHVQKRMGMQLRRLWVEHKDVKIPTPSGESVRKGLKGANQLTADLVNRLQIYYGIAIRSHTGDKPGMILPSQPYTVTMPTTTPTVHLVRARGASITMAIPAMPQRRYSQKC